jgi:multidrug resistance efflux pump
VPYNVNGYVKKVYAKANEPLKKCELLPEIDPAPHQYAVNQIDAQLNAAKVTVTQSRASLEAVDANAAKLPCFPTITSRTSSREMRWNWY